MRGLMQAVERAGGYVPLAQLLGVHPRTVRRWHLQGSMPAAKAARIARRLGVTIQANEADHGGLPLLQDAIAAGWTLPTLAQALGVQMQTVRRWIRKRRIPAAKEREIKKLI
jgi:predicted site-specific integrase-resolvase